ncbi:MAG: hypothetical protein Q8K58_00460 [Acidimicrobiales bacterium]|nr:hypothetical protein [Acidimicrobiales bacterium]
MTAAIPQVDLADTVPAAAVDDLLDAVRDGLDHLFEQVETAEREADAAEEKLLALHTGPDGGSDRIGQLQASVEELARSGDGYFRMEVDAASARAAARLADARAYAAWLVVDAQEHVAAHLAGAAPVVTPPPPVDPAAMAGAGAGDAREREDAARFVDFWQLEQAASALRGQQLAEARGRLVPVLVAVAVLVLLLLWIG